MTAQTIGFIGLGDMGKPMAGNLLSKGFRVVSCANRNRQAIEELKQQGLIEKENPKAVAEEVDVLMTIVVDEAQTETVLRGENGALPAMKSGSTIIIMSTTAPDYCQKLAALASQKGVDVIDCPVSGGTMGAENATLALIAGGDVEALERCSAALETMGKVFHCGDVGMGMVAKLANNGLLLGTAAFLIEMRAVAKACGMDISMMMEILQAGTANCFMVQNWDHVMLRWQHLIPLAEKDMNLCRDTGRSRDVEMPMLDACLGIEWTEINQQDL